MDELKKQLEQIALSDETYQKITKIGDKHNLMIDLQGELAAVIRNIIIGYQPAKDFVKNIEDKLEVSADEAREIAIDANLEILEPIQDKLQQIQKEAETRAEDEESSKIAGRAPINLPTGTISDIEQAGDFTIDLQPSSSSDQYNDTTISKEAVLKGIEDQPIPMVDHLLTTPVSAPQQIEVKKVPEKPVEKKGYAADPYREAI